MLSKPGDSVEYTFDIVNDGTFFAGLVDFAHNTPECIGTGENATEDAANVCKNLNYYLEYVYNEAGGDRYPLYYDETWDPSTHSKVGFCVKEAILNPKNMLNDDFGSPKIYAHFIIQYSAETPADELSKNDVVISNLDAQFNFRQVDKPCTKPSDYKPTTYGGSIDVDWGKLEFN